MKRSLGALLVLVVLAAPVFIAPAVIWPGSPQAPPAEDVALHDLGWIEGAYAGDGESGSRALLQAASSTVFTFADSESAADSASAALATYRIRAGTPDEIFRVDLHDAEALDRRQSVVVGIVNDEEKSSSTEPIPLHALVLLEAQRTLVAVGVSAHPSMSGGFASANLFAHPPSESFAKSLVTTTSETGMVPGWMLHATWILLLVAIGLTLRPVFAAGLVGLFSRFNQSDVLEHARRSQLFSAVQADPGASLGELCARTMLAAGVVQHHLRLLEHHGVVRRLRDGRTTRFYPRGPRFPSPALRNETRHRLVEILRNSPALEAKQLADRLGQRPQSTWHHLRILEAAGVLTQTRVGRSMRWRATT